MFDSLSNRLEAITDKLRGAAVLREADVDEALREIRLALLEGDVNVDVASNFCARVRERALSTEVSKALSPGQQIVKVVNEELVRILGGETFKLNYASRPPTVILLAGLQGAGKTTAAGKLAEWFKKEGRGAMLVGADLQRPAAVEQLKVLAGQVGVSFFSQPGSDPTSVAKSGIDEGVRLGKDVVIVDTAGRTVIDEELMGQVRDISKAIKPTYTFLVIDAMIGQEAVTTAKAFHDALELDAVILSKLDGDSRGGAALSVREVVGKPIAFASVGEKLSDFEQFAPDRMAGRILGMGDVATLIEKAEAAFDADVAQKQAERLTEGQFDLEDFLTQMQQVKKMGPLQGIMSMMPGMPKDLKNAEIDDREIVRVEAIIQSMTPKERRNPDTINAARRQRIAAGSGSSLNDVNKLLKQFKDVQKMMSGIGGAMGKAIKKSKKKGAKGSRITPKGTKSTPAGGAMPGLPGGIPGDWPADFQDGLSNMTDFPSN